MYRLPNVSLVAASLLLVVAGCSDADDDPRDGSFEGPDGSIDMPHLGSCDGSGAEAVPAGYPRLGGDGCRARLTATYTGGTATAWGEAPVEFVHRFGLQPQPNGLSGIAFDESLPVDPAAPPVDVGFELHLEALEPADYDSTGCSEVRTLRSTDTPTTRHRDGDLQLTIDGRSGDLVWGTIHFATLCYSTRRPDGTGGFAYDDHCDDALRAGRFSAFVETSPRFQGRPEDQLCTTHDECAAYFPPNPNPSRCARVYCHDGRCDARE